MGQQEGDKLHLFKSVLIATLLLPTHIVAHGQAYKARHKPNLPKSRNLADASLRPL